MLTPRQELARQQLPVVELAYYESCALLDAVLTPAQRLSRQSIVRSHLASLNLVRAAAGLPLVASPQLLSIDELLQPTGRATPQALREALEAVESKPALFCVVSKHAGSNAQAA